MKLRVIAAILSALALGGCETLGSRLGGGAKTPAPTTVDATSPNAITGEFLNTEGLDGLTEGDRKLAREAQFKALSLSSAGQPIVWRNSTSGTYGQVTPGQRYTVNGLSCRDFTHIVFVGTKSGEKKGTACQQPTGGWQIITS